MIFVHGRFKKNVSLLYNKCEYYSNTNIILHFNRSSVRNFYTIKKIKNVCYKINFTTLTNSLLMSLNHKKNTNFFHGINMFKSI